jgi:hypothetical protein
MFTTAANAAEILAMLQRDGVEIHGSRLFLENMFLRHVIVDEDTGERMRCFLDECFHLQTDSNIADAWFHKHR